MADYPASAFNPATRSAGQSVASAHMNDVQAEIRAIELALLTSGLAHNLLFVDATHDIGASGASRPRDLFLSRNAVIGGTLDVTGLATVRSNEARLVDGHPSGTPGIIAGVAQIYVDGSDGDLKVRFGDGTIKTIVADT
jgi:hypothetical protein